MIAPRRLHSKTHRPHSRLAWLAIKDVANGVYPREIDTQRSLEQYRRMNENQKIVGRITP